MVKKLNDKQEKQPGERLYVDLSWIKNKSQGGKQYWLLIADDTTPKKWSFFFSKKDDQYGVLLNFLQELKQSY